MDKNQVNIAKERSLSLLLNASIPVTTVEADRIEIADFGLNDLTHIGLQLLTYVNTQRVCAKELILFPGQTCPEHFHPPHNGEPGKEETFRCRAGEVYLYVPGEETGNPRAKIPNGFENYFTSKHEVILLPGDQFTIFPGTPHWFQAGPAGAIVSEFSTRSTDELDIFFDPRIIRAPQIEK